ncbi:endolytic transglycosylase MltG [Rhodovulum sulfidophilum]|uniref:endolytic transglycosylase MltG n=1 Tax=Rhodovulum sulfidophilum TaxID=35806 RepID=UPI0019253EA4|nr:endolytic transglycosylase MltG [Rhodovulum sulfidophilum]MBL3586369.1 endolytic transglycosylase MltG [Rhodovulum sulfidophilum]
MWKAVASNALTLFIVVLLFAGGLLIWAKQKYAEPGPLETAICLRVEPGATMVGVSRDLGDQEAVRHPLIFRLGARYAEKDDDLKAGSFLLPAHASMEEIVDLVTRVGRSTCGTDVNFRIGIASAELQVRTFDPATGRYEEVLAFDPGAGEVPADYASLMAEPDLRYRVTLAEGVTSWQVVDELKQADFLDGDIAAVPAEGSLAPDSYEVTPGEQRETLLAEMAARQTALLDRLWETRAEGLPLASKEEALVLASIVEKETGVPGERRRVASVFVNRLERGIRLQTDPTVIYGLTMGKAPLGRGIRQSELARRTPYNTYQIDGLPPTPIANPGRASIEAVLNPETTEYLYFVADGTGGHAFARSLDEHNRNVARWRAIEAGRGGN